MNILLINQYAITPDMPGGTRHFSLLKRLVKKGHRAEIIASKSRHVNADLNEKLFYDEVREGVKFRWVRSPKYEGNTIIRLIGMCLFSFSAIWNQLFKSKFKPDVVWATSPHLFQGLSGYILAKIYRVPFVLEIRDLWPQTFLDLGNFSKWHPFIIVNLLMEKFLYRAADKIVTLLPGSEAHIEKKGARKDKIVWIPNGIDISIFEKLPVTEKNIGEQNITCLYSGAHGLANNLDTILDTASLLKTSDTRVKFNFIGDGPQRARLEKRVLDEKITNAHFFGPVEKSEILNKCLQADILLESKHDTDLYKWGFSFNKIYDYMAAAKPIILAIKSPYKPVDEAQCGLTIEPDNPQKFQKAITTISNKEPRELQKMGASGKTYVMKWHDFDILANKLESVFHDNHS